MDAIPTMYTPDEDSFNEMLTAMDNLNDTELHDYLCESCDKSERLTEKQAFDAGWDYPPFMGAWGIVSPRTCGTCLIDTTAYWALLTNTPLTEKHRATIMRIIEEVGRE